MLRPFSPGIRMIKPKEKKPPFRERCHLLSVDLKLHPRFEKQLDSSQKNELSILRNDCLYENDIEYVGSCRPVPKTINLIIAFDISEYKLVFEFEDRKQTIFEISAKFISHYIEPYLLVCKNYNSAAVEKSYVRLEAMDMGRRGLHDEAARALQELLQTDFGVSHGFARRIFSILAVLYQVSFSS